MVIEPSTVYALTDVRESRLVGYFPTRNLAASFVGTTQMQFHTIEERQLYCIFVVARDEWTDAMTYAICVSYEIAQRELEIVKKNVDPLYWDDLSIEVRQLITE